MSTVHPDLKKIRNVSSRQNSLIKDLRRAFAQGGPLDDDASVCAIESMHIVEEAARSGVSFRAIFLTPAKAAYADKILGFLRSAPEVLIVPEDVFKAAVPTQAPQGIAALIETPAWELATLSQAVNPFLLCIAGLQDPGNLGTIVRSAEAFGASGIVLMPGTVNIWNAKVVRGSAGSVFRLPHAKAELFQVADLKKTGVRLLATMPRGGIPPWEVDLAQPCSVFIGNEGAGLPNDLMPLMDQNITIPQKNPVESVNAAVAASIISYEAFRQRGA